MYWHIFLDILQLEDYDYSKVHFGGWLNKPELLLELSKGGFGLVWGTSEDSKDEKVYYKMNCSYKLASYLSAGIPVIVPDYLSNADFVKEKRISKETSKERKGNTEGRRSNKSYIYIYKKQYQKHE